MGLVTYPARSLSWRDCTPQPPLVAPEICTYIPDRTVLSLSDGEWLQGNLVFWLDATGMTGHKSLWPTVFCLISFYLWPRLEKTLGGGHSCSPTNIPTRRNYAGYLLTLLCAVPARLSMPALVAASGRYTNFLLAVHTVQQAVAEHRARRVTTQREPVCGHIHKHRRESERGGRARKDRNGKEEARAAHAGLTDIVLDFLLQSEGLHFWFSLVLYVFSGLLAPSRPTKEFRPNHPSPVRHAYIHTYIYACTNCINCALPLCTGCGQSGSRCQSLRTVSLPGGMDQKQTARRTAGLWRARPASAAATNLDNGTA